MKSFGDLETIPNISQQTLASACLVAEVALDSFLIGISTVLVAPAVTLLKTSQGICVDVLTIRSTFD